jgi:hypothetical protein
MRYWILWFNLCFFFNRLLSQLCCSFLVYCENNLLFEEMISVKQWTYNTHTIASKLKKIREMLLTTLKHNQHDVIDVIWRLPVWNVKIRRYLASCTVVPKARPLRKHFQKSACLRHENSIVGMDPMATHCRISGVPSARRFYFFIRSVRAFGTTQSLLFISFTKPSMTTLPSSVQLQVRTATLNVANGSHGNTLSLDGSWFPLYFHRQRNIKFSFRRHILYWYNKINSLVVPKARPLRKHFQKSSCLTHENSIGLWK